MAAKPSVERFQLTVPGRFGRQTEYACWLLTDERRLLSSVRKLNCVADMRRHRPTGRVLVEIHDDHDPDDAWHWIRMELEDATQYVDLDPIWEEAIKWIL